MPILSSFSSKEELYLTIGEAFEEIRRSFAERSTLRREKTPALFRESFILSGYRPVGKSFAYYLKSFFMLHNESMNVWTHFFGAFVMIREAVRFYDDFNSNYLLDTMMVLMFAASSILLHFVSATAHLVHNHSERTHCTAFYFDNAAVGLSSAGASLIGFCYAAMPQFYKAFQNCYLTILIVGGVSLSTGYSYALAKYRRVYNWKSKIFMFGPTGAFFLWGNMPFLFKAFRWLTSTEYIDFQFHHLYPTLLFIIAAICYTTNFPECYYPGQFDIFGHSHQVFHIFSTLSHASVIYAVRTDIQLQHANLASNRSNPLLLEDVFITFITIVLIDLKIIAILLLKYQYNNAKSKAM